MEAPLNEANIKLLFWTFFAIFTLCIGSLVISGVVSWHLFAFGIVVLICMYRFPGTVSFLAHLMRPYGLLTFVIAFAWALGSRIRRPPESASEQQHRV